LAAETDRVRQEETLRVQNELAAKKKSLQDTLSKASAAWDEAHKVYYVEVFLYAMYAGIEYTCRG